ncbi:hypothetical protein HY988_02385 [Candidatus Micrarchaeota archaeon]|nr:hypothetical protein [Candidatus Micrarchaeota archaeon]
MKENEIKLDESGFEEVTESKTGNTEQTQGSGRKPDFRIVQPDRDKNGNAVYLNVGGMWKNVSSKGTEFYTLRIGQLKLLVFANNK